MVTSFIMFLIAGAMAVLMRVQLAVPNNNFVSLETYNQLFTMHGSIMLFLFLGPFAFRHGQLPGAAADRRPRHGLPPVQRLLLLALPGRLRHHDVGLPDLVGRRRLGLVRLRPPHRGHPLPWARAATCGSWAWPWPASPASSPPST